MGVKSGRMAAIDGVSTLLNWTIQDASNPSTFVASNTQHGTVRRKGPRDWSGTYACKGGNPFKMPGEFMDFLGLTAPDDDDVGGDGVCYSGNAIIDQVAITWNWETGETISHTVGFSGNGELLETSDSVTDATDPDEGVARGNYIVLGAGDLDEGSGSASGGDLALVNATLTFTSANQAYVNSQTNNWTCRKKGPAIDWTLAVAMHNHSGIELPFVIHDDITVVANVGVAGYWSLKYGHVVSLTGVTLDREGGKIIGMTVNLAMNGWKDGVIGEIVRPGSSQFWPALPATPRNKVALFDALGVPIGTAHEDDVTKILIDEEPELEPEPVATDD